MLLQGETCSRPWCQAGFEAPLLRQVYAILDIRAGVREGSDAEE